MDDTSVNREEKQQVPAEAVEKQDPVDEVPEDSKPETGGEEKSIQVAAEEPLPTNLKKVTTFAILL